MRDDIDRNALDRWITGNWGADSDPESSPRYPRPFVKGDTVIATQSFDEFAQIAADEMTMVTVKAGDIGRFIATDGLTVLVEFDGKHLDIPPHMIRGRD